MSIDKKERNTQIPLEAIEGAAGKDDKFAVCTIDMCLCAERDTTKTEIGGYSKREIAPNSMDLVEGMSIKAETGEKKTISRDEEPQI